MMHRYDGLFPWMTQWWTNHLNTRAIVVIKCAHDKPRQPGRCGEPIGEVKRDADVTLALRRMVQPEPHVPRPRLAAPNEAELAERAAEREQHVLKRYGGPDGQMEVMKQRRDLPAAVAPVESFPSYYCPIHGEVAVDIADLVAFVAETDDTQSATRTYWSSR